MGRVLAELDRLGLRQNTIVVFVCDHGYRLGEKGTWSKARLLFKMGTRVPLMIDAPQARGNGRSCMRTVQSLDLYATLAELCGLPVPPGNEGHSRVPLLHNPRAAWLHPAFSVWSEDGRSLHGVAVRNERWRYAEFGPEGACATLAAGAAVRRGRDFRQSPLKRPRGAPYTWISVSFGHKLVLLALAAGILRAADTPDLVYKFHLALPAAKAEWSSTGVSNWDVTVTLDAAKCEITCAYRLKRQSPAYRLAPPAVAVRIYSDLVSVPDVVTVDPAGLNLPTAARNLPGPKDHPYIPGRKVIAAAPPQASEGLPAASPQRQPDSAGRPPALAAAAPLRI